MFSEAKVTEIYCMADDFCKEFALQQKKFMVEDKSCKHRNKPNRKSFCRTGISILLPLTIFIKQVLFETCTGISFVNQTAPGNQRQGRDPEFHVLPGERG